jgi:low temperature requirement protein LtrA
VAGPPAREREGILRIENEHGTTAPAVKRSAWLRLWQPPARFEDRSTDRRVTFLELFFDLVFVVVISQLAHRLATHPSWEGVGWFVFLFYAVWSSWINGTLYHDMHTTDDLSVRVFTFAQMLTVAVMAAFIGDVPGEGSAGFALSYAANGLILVALWSRTGIHDPSHRPASFPYSTAYFLSAVLFATSAAVSPPGRYWMWAGGLALEVCGILVAFRRWTPPATQGGEAVIATSPSLIERLGLFVIIVLGEVVVGAVNGMADIADLGMNGIAIGLLGVLVAIGLWMIYFDLASHEPPISRRTQLWLYLHLGLVIAIAAGGAGVLNAVEHAAEPLPDAVRWLLVGALAMAMFSVVLIARTLQIARAQPEAYLAAQVFLTLSGLLCLGVGLTGWGAKATLGAMVILLVAPIASGIYAWLRYADPDTVDFG